MIRSTTAANTRAIDKILMGRKPVDACECDQAQDLQRRIDTMRPFVERAIEKLAEIASSPESAAGVAVLDLRKAISALESDE
jgi:hypothetical protein